MNTERLFKNQDIFVGSCQMLVLIRTYRTMTELAYHTVTFNFSLFRLAVGQLQLLLSTVQIQRKKQDFAESSNFTFHPSYLPVEPLCYRAHPILACLGQEAWWAHQSGLINGAMQSQHQLCWQICLNELLGPAAKAVWREEDSFQKLKTSTTK